MSSEADAPPCTAFAGPTPTIAKVVPERCIKILLATDNHIGYAEDDPVRGRDSINTFREILELAVENDVDMLLLAGDLFHENNPSRTSLYQTTAALREYTRGSRPVELIVVGDEGIGIARNAPWSGVNYEDENINVGLPVFSIHGNHDDPQGTGVEGALCALDLLSASGLVNYFGRVELPGNSTTDAEAIEEGGITIKPVLLQKGSTKLALYGIGNIRDERFHYEMKNGRIALWKPKDDAEEWFNLLLIHQNRVPRGPGLANYTAETSFGDDANLIVWGHEHDCIDEAGAVPVTGKRYYISQPGSSIATSLAKGESIPKHVSLVTIQGAEEFEMRSIRLRTVRPFIFDEIVLADAQKADPNLDLRTKSQINQFLKKKVNKMIKEANAEWDELNPDSPEEERLLPLIRLRVDWNEPEGVKYDVGNPQRFGQDYVDLVANPRDIVQFHAKRTAARRTKVKMDGILPEDLEELGGPKGEKVEITTLVNAFLAKQDLGILPPKSMQQAVDNFVDKKDTNAMSTLVRKILKDAAKKLAAGLDDIVIDANEDSDTMADNAIKQLRPALEAQYDAPMGKKKKGKQADESEEEEAELFSDDSMASARPVKKKAAAVAKKGKGKKVAVSSDEEEEEEEEDSDDSVASSKKKKPAAKKVAVKPVKKTPVVKKPAAKKKAAVIEINTASESNDSSDPEIVKKPVKKRK